MKKIVPGLLFLLFFMIAGELSAQLKVRPYGTIGYSGGEVYTGKGSPLSYGGGLQGFYQFNRFISLGLDLAYLHAFTAKFNAGDNPSDTVPGNSNYLNTLIVMDTSFANNLFVLQLGMGGYWDVSNYHSDAYGIMVGFGLDIPINKRISIPALTRMDFIISAESPIVFSLMVGVTYRFGSRFLNW